MLDQINHFFLGARFVVAFLVVAFLAIVALRVVLPRFFDGPAASRILMSSRACSGVMDSGSVPLGMVALVVPSVTYGP